MIPLLVAALAAGAPPLALWLAIRRGQALLGLLLAAGLLALGPWLVHLAVDPALAVARAAWLDGAPHDWSALDQPARKALVEQIRTRLAHGKLVAALPDVALGLGGAGVALMTVRLAYGAWQIRRRPTLPD